MNKRLHGLKCAVGVMVTALTLPLSAQAQTTLGIGTGIMPQYEGAKKYKAQVYPLFSYEKDNFFLGPKVEMPAAGLQAHLADNWKAGQIVMLWIQTLA